MAGQTGGQEGQAGAALDGEASVPGELYELGKLPEGYTNVTIETAEKGNGFLLVDSGGPALLHARQTGFNQLAGQSIGFVAWVSEADRRPVELTGAAVELRVLTPDNTIETRKMAADGEHSDQRAGDRVYAGSFVAKTAGEYLVQVIFRGSDRSGAPVLRTTEHLVPVVPEIH